MSKPKAPDVVVACRPSAVYMGMAYALRLSPRRPLLLVQKWYRNGVVTKVEVETVPW